MKKTPIEHLDLLAAAPDSAFTLTSADTKAILGLSASMLDYHISSNNLYPRKLTRPPRYRAMRYFHPLDLARFKRDRRKPREDTFYHEQA